MTEPHIHPRLATIQAKLREALGHTGHTDCEHKGRTVDTVHITRSGARYLYRACERCGQAVEPGEWLPTAGRNLDELPVGRDDRWLTPPCVRCGTFGTELHHFAPRHIFGAEEAELWPKAWLCPGCHHYWHDRIKEHAW